MFCNVIVVLSDGRPYVVGGNLRYDPFYGERRSAAYDAATGTFSDPPLMPHGRWYPTVTMLATAGSWHFLGLADSVNAVGSAAALAALEDTEYVELSVRRNVDNRQEFLNEASTRMLMAIDSHTNFVMLDTDRPAPQVIEHFRIAIAGFFPYFAKYTRVSLNTPAEMREFWRVWDLMTRLQKMSMKSRGSSRLPRRRVPLSLSC